MDSLTKRWWNVSISAKIETPEGPKHVRSDHKVYGFKGEVIAFAFRSRCEPTSDPTNVRITPA